MRKKSIMGLEYKWEVLVVYLIGLLGFIFSFMKNKVDPDVKFQYNQSGTIFMISLSLGIVSNLFRHTIGFIISYVIGLTQILLLVASIVVIIKAFNDETYEIPVIGSIAKAIWK